MNAVYSLTESCIYFVFKLNAVICMASNALLGKLILALTLSSFFYYTFWIGVLPFTVIEASEESWIYSLFPDRKFAFLIPAVFGVLLLGGLAGFTLYHLRGQIRPKGNRKG